MTFLHFSTRHLSTLSLLTLCVASLGFAAIALTGCDKAADQAATTANAPGLNEVETNDAPVNAASMKAICKLVPIGDSKAKGAVSFTQNGNRVEIHGEVTGLKPGKHGFHVHEKGDLSDQVEGKSTGGHFNHTER